MGKCTFLCTVPCEVDIRLQPEDAFDAGRILSQAAAAAGWRKSRVAHHRVVRRSIDARQRKVVYQLRVQLFEAGERVHPLQAPADYQDVSNAPEIHIIGAGPAGLFAALRCLEVGRKPVIWERGKDVRARRRDLAAIHKQHTVDPDSNYCFGEGGAGTYSDGKLYTRSKKRGDVRRILEILVEHGAETDILIDVHPHIGTNKLPGIIAHMREVILAHGGQVHFEQRVTDLLLEKGRVAGLEVGGKTVPAEHVLLATGHSARDIFEMLHRKGLTIEFKPFALGVRAEHPQSLVDAAQYKRPDRGDILPAAAYRLVQQVDGAGVYSFCMCPGGIIAPCATEQEEVVTNGWSPSKRNNPFANSGIVTEVKWEDIPQHHHKGPLAGVAFQREVEQACWKAAGSTQAAPAQRLVDFVAGRASKDLPVNSYQPGTEPVRLDQLLPPFIANRLREAFNAFDRKIKGYLHPEAIVVAPESRTSSPVRIPRVKETLEHPEARGLYPCGEGAGFAGGIVSAALDGRRVIDACVQQQV